MSFDGAWLSAYSIVKLALAVWLFSRTLPKQPASRLRATLVLAGVAGIAAASVAMGFSVFPTLTDDLSLLTAVLTFMAELALAVVAQRLVYECPLWTSVFCCSMAYSLENLSSAAERTLGFL